ncbi:hypothetical protein AQJ23_08675 [Streptomyces antibioticus]|nr:hypothetical protein AQJ23_08675 [Streptomyces antibioticus]
MPLRSERAPSARAIRAPAHSAEAKTSPGRESSAQPSGAGTQYSWRPAWERPSRTSAATAARARPARHHRERSRRA